MMMESQVATHRFKTYRQCWENNCGIRFGALNVTNSRFCGGPGINILSLAHSFTAFQSWRGEHWDLILGL